MPDSSLAAPAEPIWVVDPHSGQQVNVGPLLRTLHTFESEPGQSLASGAQASVQRVLRFVGGIVHDFQTTDTVDLANVHDELWRLWDFFEQIDSYPYGDPNEKCIRSQPAI